MSATWQMLLRLTEAEDDVPAKDRLLNYIKHKYGDHAAEVARREIEKYWNSEGLPQLRKQLSKFGDNRILKILDRAKDEVRPSRGDTRRDRIAGLHSGEYMSPDQLAAKNAAAAEVGAMRPDRAGTQAPAPLTPTKVAPGVRPTHDVGQSVRGTSPQHTRPPQRQVSQQGDVDRTVGQQMDFLQGLLAKDPDHPQAEKIQAALDKLSERDPDELLKGPTPQPTSTGADIESTRASLEKLRRRYQELQGVGEHPGLIKKTAKQATTMKNAAMNSSDPDDRARLLSRSQELHRQVSQMRAEVGEIPAKLQDMERSLARMTQTGKAGLADAQRKVDAIYKSGYPKVADKKARELGVPPTEVRMSVSKDPETGKEKKVYNVWSAEKIAKWRNSGPDLPAGTYDKVPGVAGFKSDPKNQKHFDPQAPAGPWTGHHADKAPEAGDDRQPTGSEPLQKPMMAAPKGLSKDELQQLSDLRHKYRELKKAGAGEDELALAKEPIDAIMSKGSEIVQVVRPGQFPGQKWQPAGVSRDVKTSRPDKTTGHMVHGMRTTDPRQERQALVWDPEAYDWVLPSKSITKNAERNADLRQEPGERRPWMSQAQHPPGAPVPTSAELQKKQAQTEPAPKKGPTMAQQHRDIKGAVHQAFHGKKDKEDEPEETPADTD